jgi:pyrroline-5-carboxylate reductase
LNTIGFIGVGELALYTIKGLRAGGYSGRILLSPRNRDNYVVIATRPANCLDTLAALEFNAGQVLISVVAGVEIEQLRTVVPTDLDIVRAMPVSSAEASASPTLIYPDHDFVRQLFDHCGNVRAPAVRPLR